MERKRAQKKTCHFCEQVFFRAPLFRCGSCGFLLRGFSFLRLDFYDLGGLPCLCRRSLRFAFCFLPLPALAAVFFFVLFALNISRRFFFGRSRHWARGYSRRSFRFGVPLVLRDFSRRFQLQIFLVLPFAYSRVSGQRILRYPGKRSRNTRSANPALGGQRTLRRTETVLANSAITKLHGLNGNSTLYILLCQ